MSDTPTGSAGDARRRQIAEIIMDELHAAVPPAPYDHLFLRPYLAAADRIAALLAGAPELEAERDGWRHVAEYFLGKDFVGGATWQEARAEAVRQAGAPEREPGSREPYPGEIDAYYAEEQRKALAAAPQPAPEAPAPAETMEPGASVRIEAIAGRCRDIARTATLPGYMSRTDWQADADFLDRLAALRAETPAVPDEVRALRAAMEELFPPEEGYTEAFDTLVEKGLLVEVPASDEFREEWESDTMYVWAWTLAAVSSAPQRDDLYVLGYEQGVKDGAASERERAALTQEAR